jgi:hypothetical protein
MKKKKLLRFDNSSAPVWNYFIYLRFFTIFISIFFFRKGCISTTQQHQLPPSRNEFIYALITKQRLENDLMTPQYPNTFVLKNHHRKIYSHKNFA